MRRWKWLLVGLGVAIIVALGVVAAISAVLFAPPTLPGEFVGTWRTTAADGVPATLTLRSDGTVGAFPSVDGFDERADYAWEAARIRRRGGQLSAELVVAYDSGVWSYEATVTGEPDEPDSRTLLLNLGNAETLTNQLLGVPTPEPWTIDAN